MKLANQILDLYEEELVKLDSKHIREISKELLEYTKDWPEEVFTVFKKGLDIEVSVKDVKNLFETILDATDYKIDYKNVTEHDLSKIFEELKEEKFTYETKDFEVIFTVHSCKYLKNKDMLEVATKNIHIVD